MLAVILLCGLIVMSILYKTNSNLLLKLPMKLPSQPHQTQLIVNNASAKDNVLYVVLIGNGLIMLSLRLQEDHT